MLTYSRITRNGGYHSLLAVSVLRLTYSMLQPNLDPENSSVSFKTKVLFTNRQVTKSNCINLTRFGLRQNVQVLRITQSLLWYQCTAVLLTYYHVINVPYKLLNSSRLHCYSRGSQWNSTPRGLTTIIWSLKSLLRRKEQSKWEETVLTMLRFRRRQHLNLLKKHLIAINYQQSQNLEPSWPSLTSYTPNTISEDACITEIVTQK